MSTNDAITIVQARFDQLDAVSAILDEATLWVRSQGGQQWPLPFPHERLLDRFANGAIYLALLDGAEIGTFSLQPADPLFWGETLPDALYLHGLAIRRSVGGRGVGQHLVRWSEQRVLEAGRRYLRLDCQGHNLAIQRYYQQQGFVDRGGVVVRDRPYRLMEKQIAASRSAHDMEATR